MHLFRKKRILVAMIAPTLILYVVYIILPIFGSVYYSFTNYTGVGAAKWIGLTNYKVLANDFIFRIALKNNFIVLVMDLLIQLPLAFCVALLLNRSFRGSNLVKAMVFSPHVIAPLLVGLMWVYILDPYKGLINSILTTLGFEEAKQMWIGGTKLTPFSVSLVSIWQHLGSYATIFLAGLKGIPDELYEAASIDGANAKSMVFRITIPMLKETITIILVLLITNSFKVFEILKQLTNGGPSYMSQMLVLYMYQTTFTNSKYGYGMSIAVVTFLISGIFALIYLRMINRQQDLEVR